MDRKSNEDCCSFYEAVKNWDFELIDKFVKNGTDINASLVQTGPKAGYTALHFACWQGLEGDVWNIDDEDDYVSRLISDYGANVNSVGEDGAQPLHVAFLLGCLPAIDTLSNAGADIDSEFSKELCEKYNNKAKWSDDFGGKLTPLAFAIINNNVPLFKCLLKNKANVSIKSTSNKTLLMYALNTDYEIINEMIHYLYNRPELINAYDNDGLHVAHYYLPKDVFGEFRYYENISLAPKKFVILMELKSAGMDIHATVNGDPDTLLLNMAALRGCYHMLQTLMDFDTPMSSKSKALRNATLPVDPEKFMRRDKHTNEVYVMNEMRKTREKCIEYILENLIIRRTFELFVPEEEKELMDHLIATDIKIKKFVRDYHENYIEGILKKYVIYYRDVRMTFHELFMRIFHRRPLELCDQLVDSLEESARKMFSTRNQIYNLFYFMSNNVRIACKRRKLLEKVKKIRNLKKAIPLPYELILKIIEYLNNYYLENFIDAFYENSVSSN